jgi:hypothetical protein
VIVPLTVQGAVIGVLYADTIQPGARLSDRDASLALAIADQAGLASLCVDALGRINVNTPANSILVQYVQPTTSGGMASHVFKLDDATFSSFKAAVSTWAAAEK